MGKKYFHSTIPFIYNIFLAYCCYFVCRIIYILENYSSFSHSLFNNSLSDLIKGSLLFDTSAIMYTFIPYALLMLIPLHIKDYGIFGYRWHKVAKWLFLFINFLAIISNLSDAVYFRYTGRRTTLSVFDEFSGESNLGNIFRTELLNHWYLVLIALLIIFGLYLLYLNPLKKEKSRPAISLPAYYVISTIIFLVYIILAIGGMRGGLTTAIRPITISNANQYVNHPQEAAAILNTPFTLIRTSSRKAFADPHYFTQKECEKIFSPLHNPQNLPDLLTFTASKKNVVILIVESFGREYMGFFNKHLDGGKYKGFTPCMDSIASQSLTFEYSFCNGRKSIDGMPSILSSIPMFVEPFFLTPSSMNDVGGLAYELGKDGYYSAFFHGAENGSMGFQAFARATGFNDYFGRTEYNQDKRFNGDKDFDGTWAIWDEPFLQYFATKMSEMKQPFFTSIFTASSHHPFVVPDKYKKTYPEEGTNPIHKCIRYTDMALGKFFQTASCQPWYKNTIFVLTSDHTNGVDHPEYGTDLGSFSSPIIIFDPSGEIKADHRKGIAQQIDIMPTILHAIGHTKPYIAFGKDLLVTKPDDTWAVNYANGIYQFVKGEYLIQFDGQHLTAVYKFKTDKMLTANLLGKDPNNDKQLERQLKAIIQSYMYRMVNNKLRL